MRSRDILNAMGKIDSRLIDEALEAEAESISDKPNSDLAKNEYYPESVTEMKVTHKKIGFLRWAGLAAAVSAITVGAIFMSQLGHFNGIDSTPASTGVNITLSTTAQTSAPAETEITDGKTAASETAVVDMPSNSEAALIKKPEILPNGLPDVPLAELKSFDEYFTAESLDYVHMDGLNPKFIADGIIYYTDISSDSTDRIMTKVTLLSYNPDKDELREIFIDNFPDSESVDYYFLCAYGDYIYFYRSVASDAAYARSSEEYPYTDISVYTLCRLNAADGKLQELANVTLELIPYISDCAVYGDCLYFEEIVRTDNDAKKHVYNISRLNLINGSISTFAENARCPLLYDDKLVFYRDGAFWQRELNGSKEQVLFYDTVIDFFKDRLCSDGSHIVLARNYTETKEDLSQYSAFTIEVYNGVNGFVPKALFTADVSSKDYFFTTHSSPVIKCSDGLFSFLDIIFDPETDAFIQIESIGDNSSFQTIMADKKIYCWAYDTDWSSELSDPIVNTNYYLFKKKEQ